MPDARPAGEKRALLLSMGIIQITAFPVKQKNDGRFAELAAGFARDLPPGTFFLR